MNTTKELKVELARRALINHDVYFLEFANGHFQIDNINFWATSGTWIDHPAGKRGNGLNNLLDYIEGGKQ
jgi:hypothetical protein